MIPDDLSPLWISLATAIVATALAFVLGIAAAAWMLRVQSRWRGWLDGLLTLPLVLPPTVVGFFLLLIFGRHSVIGGALETIGLRVAFSWPATVIAATVVSFPLMYRAALGGFEQVSENLLGAARTLGAGEWRTFREVLFPLARPAIVAGVVLTFARALGEFGATLMLAGNIPGRTQTMPIAIFFAADGGDLDRALGWVVLIVALSLVSITMLNYWVPRKALAPAALEGSALGSVPAWHSTARRSGEDARGALAFTAVKRYPAFELRVAFDAGDGTLGLLGASGSGKSMTLRCLAGLERPDSGRIELNGRVLFDSASGVNMPPAARKIGVVFQDYALFPHMAVRENIGFSLHRLAAAVRDERVRLWARRMQVEALLERMPGELSGGQRQRVALARALAMEPEALLLDEPLSALDAHLRRRMEAELRDLLSSFAGVSILVTHDRDEAFRCSERLVVLAGGRVAASGNRKSLFENPGNVDAARITGCRNIAAAVAEGVGRVRVEAWRCSLEAAGATAASGFVGIRAHDVILNPPEGARNVFPCWLVETVESPFEQTLYLRLHAAPVEGETADLEVEISRAAWAEMAARPQPWRVALPPEHLLILE